MMMHTPGPWRFQQDGHEPYWSVDMPFTDGSGRYGAYNAMVYTTEADARLVAAAPELLAALKNCRDWLVNICDSSKLESAERGFLEQATVAIAKAEGRAE